MWLDRFSAQSTPSATPPPQGRPYSPASRRPYQPPGPGLNPRSSSLSLISASSSATSLPTVSRLPNGSVPRGQANGTPQHNGPDPIQVLERIFDGPPRKRERDNESAEAVLEKPKELVEDIDFKGLSLEAFATNANDNAEANSIIINPQSIEEYDKEEDKFEDLHKSILACDEVLKSVETYLTNFQADLGSVSAEIETLQSRSTALNTKLENRKVVEKLLGPSVEAISISPAVVRKLAEGPIDDSFVKALTELDERSKVIQAKLKEESPAKAVEDIGPLLSELTNRAVERIRDHVVAQIRALRSPNINAQVIQQQGFLKYKELFAFLSKHQPQLAIDVCQAYVNTMRWYYQSHFMRYQKALEKLKVHLIDKYEVIGQEDSSKPKGLLGNSRTPTVPHDAFSLGRRIEPLRNPTHGALTAHSAEEDKSTYYIEIPFRAFNLALVDNASFEYSVLTSYFGPSQSYQAISRTFNTIFEPTFAMGQALTKQLIESTTDALGILLCVRLNQHLAFELQRRKVPAVEGYINGTNMLLWPRFQIVMDLHCESLRKLAASLPGRPSASTSVLTSSSTAQSTAPHPLTQRFASFLQGILALSSEAGDDEPVSNSLSRLRSEFEAYLTRLSKGISDQRKRERFLLNNYSLIGTILADTDGKLADEMKAHFSALKDAFSSDR